MYNDRSQIVQMTTLRAHSGSSNAANSEFRHVQRFHWKFYLSVELRTL